MLRHRSGKVLEMGSVHVMISSISISVGRIVFSVQRVEANFRIDLSAPAHTVRGSIPLFTDALRMCSLTSRVVLTLLLAPHASA
jgi:hypothetical protein